MKPFLLCCLMIGLYSCSGHSQAQNQPKGWEVVFKTHIVALPGATDKEKTKVKRFNAHSNYRWVKNLMADSLYTRAIRLGPVRTFHVKFDLRDSLVYTYWSDENTAIRETFSDYKKEYYVRTLPIINLHQYPDIQKKILGKPAYKITYKSYRAHLLDSSQVTQWIAKDIKPGFRPFESDSDSDKRPEGLILEAIVTVNHTQKITKAVSIKQVPVNELNYAPPKKYTITDQSNKTDE